jgi:SAM-dependent methyltransferase
MMEIWSFTILNLFGLRTLPGVNGKKAPIEGGSGMIERTTIGGEIDEETRLLPLFTVFSDCQEGLDLVKKYDLYLKNGQAEVIDFGGRRFDVITLFHVLKHVPGPSRLIEGCYNLLSEQAILIIVIPNEINNFITSAIRRLLKSLPFETNCFSALFGSRQDLKFLFLAIGRLFAI